MSEDRPPYDPTDLGGGSRVIYKYVIDQICSHPTVRMPEGAVILDVQVQDGSPCIWALVYPDERDVDFNFRLLATGEPIEDEELQKLRYIGTFQMKDGRFVWHLHLQLE